MDNLTHYPVLVFVFSFLVLWLAGLVRMVLAEKEAGPGRGLA